MAAFYSSDGNARNGFSNEKPVQILTENKLSVNQSEKPLAFQNNRNEPEMVTVSVFFTADEKENLEKQARECETALSKLIRIRCLMDETDIRTMQQTITKQKQQIDELRIKLSFFKEKRIFSDSVNPLTEKSDLVNLVTMNKKQWPFLKEKYLESHDYEGSDSETYPDGTITNNQRDALLSWERKFSDYIKTNISIEILALLFEQIEKRLIENCGWDEAELEDEPLMERFESLK